MRVSVIRRSSTWLNVDIIEHLGDICQTLLFLIGAMTIVELIDVHGGFRIITDRITTREKRKLLWIIGFCTFFMSAILDNLTTTIVMLMLLRKLVTDPKERWLFAASIVIAANSGGAWSPIGDVTTIMLWVKGNVTSIALIKYILIPSLVSMILPLAIVSSRLKGQLEPIGATARGQCQHYPEGTAHDILSRRGRTYLCAGVQVDNTSAAVYRHTFRARIPVGVHRGIL